MQRTGGGYLYIFPATQGRTKGNDNPSGVITVGNSITVAYSLRLVGHSKARFIGLDSTRTAGISPNLFVVKASRAFGFFVRDANQTTLDVVIEPSFMAKLAKATVREAQRAVASEGNLSVTLTEKDRKIVIWRVVLD